MVVIADTSPLNYLILIGREAVLPALFGEVLMPPAVLEELSRRGTPERVREFVKQLPGWLQLAEKVREEMVSGADESLDEGEREAIALAAASGGDTLLLIDEVRGRAAAERRSIRILGTLGVLDLAAARGLIDVRAALEDLLRTNFRVSQKLVDRLLEREESRRRGS